MRNINPSASAAQEPCRGTGMPSSIRSLRQRERGAAWTATSSCFGGFEIDDKNKFGRLINRAAEDSAEHGVRFVLRTNATT